MSTQKGTATAVTGVGTRLLHEVDATTLRDVDQPQLLNKVPGISTTLRRVTNWVTTYPFSNGFKVR